MSAFLWTLFLITYATGSASNIVLSSGNGNGESLLVYVTLDSVASLLGILTMVFGTYFVCTARQNTAAIRNSDRAVRRSRRLLRLLLVRDMFHNSDATTGITGRKYAPCSQSGEGTLDV